MVWTSPRLPLNQLHPGDEFAGIVFGAANCDGLFNLSGVLYLLLVFAGLAPSGGHCHA